MFVSFDQNSAMGRDEARGAMVDSEVVWFGPDAKWLAMMCSSAQCLDLYNLLGDC